MTRWMPALALLALAAPALAADPPMAKPEEVGLSAQRLQRMTAHFKQVTDKGEPPGVVALVARGGKAGYFEAFGLRDAETKAPMTKDSMFRIYSMTKPITSVAVMMLWEEGRFRLTDPVSQYLPEFKDQKVLTETVNEAGHRLTSLVPVRREMSIQDLLRHTSGLTYGNGESAQELAIVKAGLKGGLGTKENPMLALTHAEYFEKLGKQPLLFHPGTSWEYGRSTDVLGYLVEKVSGQTLDKFFDERIFKPLGMTDSYFNPPADKVERIANTGPEGPQKKIEELWDVRQGRKFLGGGEGMVSTAADYFRFAQMLLNGGELDGQRLLGRKTVEYMTSDHLGAMAAGPTYAPGPGYGFGLGFAVRTATGMSGIPGSVGEYNWGGAGGTAFWVDPKEKLVAILMMQSPIQRIPQRFAFRSLVYQSLVE